MFSRAMDSDEEQDQEVKIESFNKSSEKIFAFYFKNFRPELGLDWGKTVDKFDYEDFLLFKNLSIGVDIIDTLNMKYLMTEFKQFILQDHIQELQKQNSLEEEINFEGKTLEITFSLSKSRLKFVEIELYDYLQLIQMAHQFKFKKLKIIYNSSYFFEDKLNDQIQQVYEVIQELGRDLYEGFLYEIQFNDGTFLKKKDKYHVKFKLDLSSGGFREYVKDMDIQFILMNFLTNLGKNKDIQLSLGLGDQKIMEQMMEFFCGVQIQFETLSLQFNNRKNEILKGEDEETKVNCFRLIEQSMMEKVKILIKRQKNIKFSIQLPYRLTQINLLENLYASNYVYQIEYFTLRVIRGKVLKVLCNSSRKFDEYLDILMEVMQDRREDIKFLDLMLFQNKLEIQNMLSILKEKKQFQGYFGNLIGFQNLIFSSQIGYESIRQVKQLLSCEFKCSNCLKDFLKLSKNSDQFKEISLDQQPFLILKDKTEKIQRFYYFKEGVRENLQKIFRKEILQEIFTDIVCLDSYYYQGQDVEEDEEKKGEQLELIQESMDSCPFKSYIGIISGVLE